MVEGIFFGNGLEAGEILVSLAIHRHRQLPQFRLGFIRDLAGFLGFFAGGLGLCFAFIQVISSLRKALCGLGIGNLGLIGLDAVCRYLRFKLGDFFRITLGARLYFRNHSQSRPQAHPHGQSSAHESVNPAAPGRHCGESHLTVLDGCLKSCQNMPPNRLF